VAVLICLAPGARAEEDGAAVREVITKAYVEGIHQNRDRAAIEAGFHPDFVMHVLSEGQLIQAPLEMWLARMTLDGTPNKKKIEAEFLSVDVTGDTATAKLKVVADGVQIYTDYFGLYRFADGWKIVNKIFQSH